MNFISKFLLIICLHNFTIPNFSMELTKNSQQTTATLVSKQRAVKLGAGASLAGAYWTLASTITTKISNTVRMYLQNNLITLKRIYQEQLSANLLTKVAVLRRFNYFIYRLSLEQKPRLTEETVYGNTIDVQPKNAIFANALQEKADDNQQSIFVQRTLDETEEVLQVYHSFSEQQPVQVLKERSDHTVIKIFFDKQVKSIVKQDSVFGIKNIGARTAQDWQKLDKNLFLPLEQESINIDGVCYASNSKILTKFFIENGSLIKIKYTFAGNIRCREVLLKNAQGSSLNSKS